MKPRSTQTQWPLSHTRALQDTCCGGDPKPCCATTDRLQEPASLAWSVHTYGHHNQAQHASPHAHLPNTTPNQVVGPTRQRTVNHTRPTCMCRIMHDNTVGLSNRDLWRDQVDCSLNSIRVDRCTSAAKQLAAPSAASGCSSGNAFGTWPNSAAETQASPTTPTTPRFPVLPAPTYIQR